jgi:hypothetical protein
MLFAYIVLSFGCWYTIFNFQVNVNEQMKNQNTTT